MGRSLLVLLTFATVVTLTTPASADPGSLDTSFSSDGIAVVHSLATSGYLADVAVADDGSVFAAGAITRGSDRDVVVMKLRPRGALDARFGGDGIVRTDVGLRDEGSGVLALPDGRVAVVGWTEGTTGRPRMLIAMYRHGGRLDRSFGGDGIVLVRAPDGLPTLWGYRLALQADGKLIAVGESFDPDPAERPGNFVVVRLRPNGRFDRSFSGDGRAVVSFGPYDDGAWRVEIDRRGRIVVAGWFHDGNDLGSAVARLLPSGRRDLSFDGDGRMRLDLRPDANDWVNGLALADDGDILLGTFGNPVVVRLRRSGALDPAFGGGDGVATDFAPGFAIDEIAVRGDGRIVLLGESEGMIATALLRDGGRVVAGYGVDGVATTVAGRVDSMDLDRKDRVVAVGRTGLPEKTSVLRILR